MIYYFPVLIYVSTQFLVFPISTRVDITVYQHGKCFIFVKYEIRNTPTKSDQHVQENNSLKEVNRALKAELNVPKGTVIELTTRL